jgi:Fe-S-cluster containining protein
MMSIKHKIFECSQCGFCCHGQTTVSLDKSDQDRMIAALGMSREELAKKFWRVTGTIVQMKTVDGHCVFYEQGCTVYNGRPWRCAQWPLVPALLKDRTNYTTISESCPGINKSLSYEVFCRLLRGYLEEKKQESEAEKSGSK